MTGCVAHIWRHPIKSHGREALTSVTLAKGATMPWDRTWAVAHSLAKTDGAAWAPCANFTRGAKVPALQAINAALDEDSETVTLTYPDRPPLTFSPDRDADKFLDWVSAIMPDDGLVASRLVRVPGRGMTDTDFPSISLNNLASNVAVEQEVGTALSPTRWRGNIWFSGIDAWTEFDWIGRNVRIGSAVLSVRAPITRCKATMANPESGLRDADTLSALRSGWDHQEFGVYGEVIKTGHVKVGDAIEVLA